MDKYEFLDKLVTEVKNHSANNAHGLTMEDARIFIEAAVFKESEEKLALKMIETLVKSKMPDEELLKVIKAIVE